MSVQAITRIGNPTLRERSTEIEVHEFGSEWLLNLVQDLWDTQAHYGSVGIAASQIGVNRRIFVFGFESTERYKNVVPVPRTVLCNPIIKITDPTTTNRYEGCLSLDNLRGEVARPIGIEYSGFDAYGNPIKRTVTNFHARLVQHETDHLDGVVFLDRVQDIKTIGFREELNKVGIF